MRLGYGELHEIARRSASRAAPYLRDDAYQEAWIGFLRYPPPNRTYAWRTAASALGRLARAEAKQQRISGLDPVLFTLPQPGTEELRRYRAARHSSVQRRRREDPRAKVVALAQHRRSYHRNLMRSRAQTRERVRHWRRRAIQEPHGAQRRCLD